MVPKVCSNALRSSDLPASPPSKELADTAVDVMVLVLAVKGATKAEEELTAQAAERAIDNFIVHSA